MSNGKATIPWKRPFPFPGIPADRFILNAQLREAILANAAPIMLATGPAGAQPMAASSHGTLKVIDGGIRGGMRAYHIHDGDRVLALDEKQWAEVSRSILDRARQQLNQAKQISFEEAAYLVEAMEQG